MSSSCRHFTPIVALLLLCCVATVASGQDTKVLVIGGRPQADVEKSFGLVANSQDPVDMRGNSEKLQAAADAGSPVYPWFFPAHPQGHIGFFIGRTIVLPTDSGRKWSGTGLASSGATGLSATGSKIIMRAQSGNISTTFDGDTRSGTTDGESDVLTVIGRDVHATDKWNSFEITGGTNFIPGWYSILEVDTDNNTWKLDRNCTSGGSGSAMEGFYCPALVQHRGYGTVNEGLHFTAKRLDADRSGGVAYHIATSSQSGTGQSGKVTFNYCAFTGFEVGVLCGSGMARAYEDAATWPQSGSGHADHLTTYRTWFNGVRTCFLHRTEQSVCHNHIAVRALGSETVFYFEGGGKFACMGLEMSGGAADRANRIIYLGRNTAPNNAPHMVMNFSWDGGGNTQNPQLLKAVNRESITTFRSGIINPSSGANRKFPLCDVTGGHSVLMESIWQLVAGEDNAILGKTYYDAVNDVTYRPHFVIRNCKWGGMSRTDPDPTDVVHADCDAGVVFDFEGNTTSRNTTFFWDGRYITDGNGGGTWVSGGPPDE